VKVSSSSWWRGVARALGVTGVILAVLVVRVLVASHGELQRAHALVADGDDVDAALVHYRRAARWYVPGSPYVREALESLARIGVESEREGDRERALFAWRSVRAAVLATRSFHVPHHEHLALADEHIAELMASEDPPPIDAGKPRSQLRAEHLALLRQAGQRPPVGWTLVLLLGFFLWVGSAFAFATRAIDEEDRWVRREAWRWGGLVVVGLALWFVGMALV
jgi:hypothetical protein